MRLPFDIDTMDRVPLVPQKESGEKGWSYSNVYFLRNIKDIYLLLYKNDFRSIPIVTEYCLTNNVVSENGKKWNNEKVAAWTINAPQVPCRIRLVYDE